MKGILFAVAFAWFAYTGIGAVFAEQPVYRNYSITVAGGDTLWAIGCRHAESNEDVRAVIKRIEKANNLTSNQLQPGQVLIIPMRVQDKDYMLAQK